MSNVTSGKYCKDEFKKFSDLNFIGGIASGELLMIGVPTSIDKSQIITTSVIICSEVSLSNFNEEACK